MDRIIYTAMSGARQALDNQAVISNNLANVNTTGFRAEMLAQRAVPVEGNGLLDTRASVALASVGADFSMGPVQQTGRQLDIAIGENGWLAVMAPDGTEAYTRRGDLQIDAQGQLTSGGLPVVGDGGPVQVPPGARVFIGEDGTLSSVGEGEDPDSISPLGALKLVSAGEEGLVRGDDGLFRPPADEAGFTAQLAADENIKVATGAIEGSNVSAVGSMVDMIANSRLYEMQMQIVQSAEENEQRANSLLSLR